MTVYSTTATSCRAEPTPGLNRPGSLIDAAYSGGGDRASKMGTCCNSLPCNERNLVDEVARLRLAGYAGASPACGGTVRRGERGMGRDVTARRGSQKCLLAKAPAGIEPASRGTSCEVSTCIVCLLCKGLQDAGRRASVSPSPNSCSPAGPSRQARDVGRLVRVRSPVRARPRCARSCPAVWLARHVPGVFALRSAAHAQAKRMRKTRSATQNGFHMSGRPVVSQWNKTTPQ